MASRAILRRKRLISGYVNGSTRSIQSFPCISHGHAMQNSDSRGSRSSEDYPFTYFNGRSGGDKDSMAKEGLLSFSGLGQIRHRYYGTMVSGLGNVKSVYISPMGIRMSALLIRNASTAAAKQPDTGNDDEENEELIDKKRKEASAEECDQAVEGLSSAKAKAKAKRLQESQKAKSVLQRVWATFLGIGPALKAVASMSRADWAKKLVHWKDEFISTLQHYWLGTKLLWADTRISSRLLLKLAGGKSLSRRERQQLTRTTADIFRLVPFAVFIIVPFMEFLLPVFLKLFPNMLPSTFQDKMKEQEALKRRLNARIEYAKFLQDTAKEMAKEVQNSRSGEIRKTAEDLDEFLNKVRRGTSVSNEEILVFAKLFNDELTLDNISRPRLLSMCKYMGIDTKLFKFSFSDAYLRYMLRKRLQRIKADDRLIQAEGVESLSEAELREDCRERGMLGNRSVEEMRQQLRDWLDLSLNHSLPSSLLILSRAFVVSGKLKLEEALQATISSLPDEVTDTVGVTALPSEDSVSGRRRKLEYLEMQEELIKEEEEKEEEEQARMKESKASQEDLALKEMTGPTAREAHEQARDRTLEKQEHLCELSRALAVLASASSVSREREEFLSLVNKEGCCGCREESDNADEVAEGEEVSSALIERVDAMLQILNRKLMMWMPKSVIVGDYWTGVASAAMYLKDTLGKEGVQELISNLSKDGDGKILVEDIVKLGSKAEDANSAEDGGCRG
ncbi:mitochondrial proton/calcium exchanger protein [Quercus suber]|uniref:Mitochondrial proton/calcium exchanger protein n=1 Tax=Quercus suber TaxID=58331 RepID=A0AAW0IKF4_QUESU